MSLSAKDYWEHRYLAGGNSGAGSKGGLLSWKADIVNAIIRENGVKSCLELGSGDGKFANLLNLKSYIGYDISPSAITLANQHIYKPNFKVKSKTPFVLRKFDIAISIDVIYHILDKKDFDNHMTKLFSAAKRLVVIYSWPQKPSETMSAHIAFNDFRSWAELQAPGWQLVDHIPNKFPFDEDNPNHTSRSEFFVYRRRMFVNRWL
jgi:SAM-dependent methyltransferase